MSGITGYRQIKAEVFRRIRAGEYAPGSLMPGETALAAEFGCARATVNRAMQELSYDGIIDRRRKGGSRVRLAPNRQVTFEIPIIRAEIEARGAQYRYHLVSSQIAPAPLWLAERWHIAGESRMRHVECLHFADGRPFQFEDRWINLNTVPQAAEADFSLSGPNEWLVAQVPYTHAEIIFSACAATPAIAAHLGTIDGAPLFQAERSTWLSGVPVTQVQLSFAAGYRMMARY